jgi:hypothetical protein
VVEIDIVMGPGNDFDGAGALATRLGVGGLLLAAGLAVAGAEATADADADAGAEVATAADAEAGGAAADAVAEGGAGRDSSTTPARVSAGVSPVRSCRR